MAKEATQTKNGKAFEYALLNAFFRQVRNSYFSLCHRK